MSHRSKIPKPAAKPIKRTPVAEISPEQQIVGALLLGKVRGYDPLRGMMRLPLEAPLAVGETIRVKGRQTDLTQRVERLKLRRRGGVGAAAGETVEIAVADQVRTGDAVYKVL
ncbi:MAG: hypothetical protein KGO96_06310 [Elusimicrobia bacterium]|nr:hypothetical protein [Elusimicrobiota bacterium]MDE2237673.1 hypothetical protein [Elusimicrobiota bacterium]MDE2425503.1 hypothetical protein [Elusimicrobiota bacterium]